VTQPKNDTIQKPNTWFKEGTECFRKEDISHDSALIQVFMLLGLVNHRAMINSGTNRNIRTEMRQRWRKRA